MVKLLSFVFSLTTILASAQGSSCAGPKPPKPPGPPPTNYGILLFPSFDLMDVFGPLESFQMLSHTQTINMALIGTLSTLAPIETKPRFAAMNPTNSSIHPAIMPTHTLTTATDLQVLIIPGGLGSRAPDLGPTIDYVKTTFPRLQYLITVCTGAGIAARAGVLDGRRATTNKMSWNTTVVHGPKVKWVRKARWVVDGNVWTASGITAGIDVSLAFIESVYGRNEAELVTEKMEYIRNRDSHNDLFAAL